MAGLREDRLDRKQVYLRIPIELCRKVLSKYGNGADVSEARPEDYFRALREAIGNESLTSEDKKKIASIVARNTESRMAARKTQKDKTAAKRAARKAEKKSKGGAS